MTEDEKLKKIRERFPEIMARICSEKNSDYQNVANREKRFFAEIFEFVQKYDKALFNTLFSAMCSPTEEIIRRSQEMERNFNLKEHLSSSYSSLVGKNADFEKAVQSEDVAYAPTVENLYTNYEYLGEDRAAEYEKLTRQTLEKIISAPGKANAELKKKLEGVTVKVGVFDCEEMDGKCQYDGKSDVLTLSLSEGCFGKHKNALGMVISHELGHFIDASERPAGYQGKMGCAQEIYADAVGYKMASVCGFDIEHYKAENRLKGGFFAERMDKIETLQTVDKAVRRYQTEMVRK